MARTRSRKANVTITESDFLPVLRERVRALTKSEVHIGMQGNAELAMVAAVHEFGSAKMKIPARSPFRIGKKRASAAISKVVRTGVNQIAHGEGTAEALFEQIGAVGQDKVKKSFNRITGPALSINYLHFKEGNKILIDEADLRESVTHVVVPK